MVGRPAIIHDAVEVGERSLIAMGIIDGETAQEGIGVHSLFPRLLQRQHIEPAIGTCHAQGLAVGQDRARQGILVGREWQRLTGFKNLQSRDILAFIVD